MQNVHYRFPSQKDRVLKFSIDSANETGGIRSSEIVKKFIRIVDEKNAARKLPFIVE